MAAEFVDQYARETGQRLDLSLDRIRDLDRYLERHFEGDPLSEEDVRRAGYFFAEIWRRTFGGSYIWDEKRGAVAIRKGGVSVFPIEKLARVLEKRTPGALEAYVFIYARKMTEA